jgi:alanyl-tRNA synthetase
MCEVAKIFIEKVYFEAYPLLIEKEEYILDEIKKEIAKFEVTLAGGMKEFDKIVGGMERKNQFMSQKDPNYVPETEISGKQAFRLYDTFGYPLELTVELANERGLTVDENGFNEAFKAHQELSKAQAQAAKGGLTEHSAATTNLHSATHLLNYALKKVLNDESIQQKGSNITPERLRFDFNLDHKMTPEEIAELEKFVNDVISKSIDVTCEEYTVDEARAKGAHGIFDSKYGEKVKVYIIGDVDKQICGGPHAKNTADLHHFKITKEESSSSGIRRIKAILD